MRHHQKSVPLKLSLILITTLGLSCKSNEIDQQGSSIDLEAYKKKAQGSYMDFNYQSSGYLNLTLPELSRNLSLTSSAIEAFEISAQPKVSSCDTNIRPIKGKVVNNKITTKLRIKKACEYNLKLKVGTASTSGSVDTIYYHNLNGTDIPKMGTRDDIKVNILVYRTAAAKKLGYPGRDVESSPPSLPDNKKEKPQDSKPIGPKKINLSSDPSLNSKNGSVKLTSLFKKKYLVAEFSESWCGYCRVLANKIHNEYQQMFKNGKCENAVFTNNLNAWNKSIPRATSVQSHSYSFGSSTISSVARIFGVTVSAYPTVAILENNNGELKVVSVQTGGLPSNFARICN